MTNESIRSILYFWFGEEGTAKTINDRKSDLWWSKNEDTDQEILTRFAAVTADIMAGNKSGWLESPLGLLASIICLDQFPRNMYRGKAECFSCDHRALELAKLSLSNRFDQELELIQRRFAYLPFEHSENIADQEQSLVLYSALVDQAPPDSRELFQDSYRFALQHHEIIARFGRFPHRNKILGRPSTPEERAFLKQPGSSF